MNSPPVLQAFVVADGIHRCPATGKYTILGTFREVMFPPGVEPIMRIPVGVYAAVTEINGEVTFSLKLRYMKDEELLLDQVIGKLRCNDPLVVAEVSGTLKGLRFGRPGLYALEFFADDVALGTWRLRMQQQQSTPGPTEGELT